MQYQLAISDNLRTDIVPIRWVTAPLTPLGVQFNPKVRLEFHGTTITSDDGLLPIRELDDARGVTPIASDYLQESRTVRQHPPPPGPSDPPVRL